MALSRENDRQQLVPVVSVVGDLLDTDPHAELVFETPPPDVVSSINECFQEFTNTPDKRKGASVDVAFSDSDSGESLFITQSVSKAVQTVRRLISPKKSASISDDSGYERVTSRLSENQDPENEEGSGGLDFSCPKRRKTDRYVPPKKATFPFLLKSLKRQHLPLDKQQVLENSEIGGFFKCIKKIEESYEGIIVGGPIIPDELVYDLIDEGDEDNSDHEVTIVDRNIFVPRYSKEQRQQWLPQSILKRRNQDSPSEKQSNSIKTSASVKKQTGRKTPKTKKKIEKRIPKSKGGAGTSCISLTEEQEKQQETHEVLASCSEAEDSAQISQCVDNSRRDDRVVIEETQRNSVKEVTETAAHEEHEDDMSSRTDHDQLNQSNFVLTPQGGDLSIQNDIQQNDSDSYSVDLFRPLDSPKHNDQNHETTSITPNVDDSSQDSDTTQIEMEGQFMSKIGPEAQRKCDGEPHAHENDNIENTQIETEAQFTSTFGPEAQAWSDAESYADEDNDNNISQIETEGESVSLLETRTPNKLFTTHGATSQKTDQSLEHSELLSRTEDKIKPKNKRETMSRSHTEGTGVEEAVNVQPSSKHLPLPEETLQDVSSDFHERVIEGRRKATVEMEDSPSQDSPLFKNTGQSFLRRKRRKDKTAAAALIESDTNVHGVHTPISDSQADDVTGHIENRESCEVEKRRINEEQMEISEDVLVDNGERTKVKRKKNKTSKLKECVDVEHFVESQLVEMVQFSEAQTELTSKGAKKKRKHKEKTKTAYVEETTTDIPLNETFDSELRVNEVNESNEAPETDQPRHIQTLEEATECLSPNVAEVKLSKKKTKKKRHESDRPQHEPVDMDVSSVSQFDAGLRVIKQLEELVNVGRQSHDCVNEPLECETVRVSKHRMKSQKRFLVDDMTGLKKQRSGDIPEMSNLDSDGIVNKKDKHKKKKRHKLKEKSDTEPASDIDNNKQFESDELQTMDLLSRSTKNKRSNKVSSSYELFGHTDDRPQEMRGKNRIQSTEADQLEHLQTSEELTRCPSPSLTRLSSGKKKKKKKRNKSEEHQHELDLNQNVSSVSHFEDITGLRAADRVATQQISEEGQNGDSVVEHNATSLLKVGKRKKKHQNISSPSQVDDIIGLYWSGNTAELEDKTSIYSSKQKKKKHKLKEREDVEPSADIHSVHNVQIDESQTTKLIPKRTKKKKKDKERTYVEENNAADVQLNEPPQIDQPAQVQMEVTQCLSPNGTKLKSTKKKKKRKRDETAEAQYEPLVLDVSSVSQFDRSTTQETVEERLSDVTEHTKHKKKRKYFSVNEDHDSSHVHLEESVTPERRKKKKKIKSDCVTNVGDDSTSGTPDCTTLFEKSQSPILKSPERISKKLKRKNESSSHLLENTSKLEAIQTKKSNSVLQNSVDGQVSSGDLLPDSAYIKKKKKKKRKTDAENNITTDSSTGVNGDGMTNRAENQRKKCNANVFVQSHRKHDTCDGTDEASGHKKKKKRKIQSLFNLDG